MQSNFNLTLNNIEYWLRPVSAIMADFRKFVLDPGTKKHRIFIDNGSKILLIAHLDTVQTPCLKKAGKKRIHAAGLDDRLGCMLGWRLANELKVDLLLTDFEETGRTTAQWHACKEYNWVCELDRAGDDVVTYGMESPVWKALLEKYWDVGYGTYSDICELDTNACCFNLGIGYEHAHSPTSYYDKKVYRRQVEKFRLFYKKHNGTIYLRDKKLKRRGLCFGFNNYSKYEKEQTYIDYPDYGNLKDADECQICGSVFGERIFDHIVCETCMDAVMETLYMS